MKISTIACLILTLFFSSHSKASQYFQKNKSHALSTCVSEQEIANYLQRTTNFLTQKDLLELWSSLNYSGKGLNRVKTLCKIHGFLCSIRLKNIFLTRLSTTEKKVFLAFLDKHLEQAPDGLLKNTLETTSNILLSPKMRKKQQLIIFPTKITAAEMSWYTQKIYTAIAESIKNNVTDQKTKRNSLAKSEMRGYLLQLLPFFSPFDLAYLFSLAKDFMEEYSILNQKQKSDIVENFTAAKELVAKEDFQTQLWHNVYKQKQNITKNKTPFTDVVIITSEKNSSSLPRQLPSVSQ